MKNIKSVLIAIILSLFFVLPVGAQSPESMWLTANLTSFKTGETLIVSFNAVSATPIQGFTFQIRYDPACMKPVNAASPISGFNGLLLPQLGGLVDATFASTTPQTANGVLAEVRFTTLGACETNITLESAALAIKSESGIAAPLPNISIPESQRTIQYSISAEQGSPSNTPLVGTPLSLEVETTSPPLFRFSTSTVIILGIIVLLLIIGIFILVRILKSGDKK